MSHHTVAHGTYQTVRKFLRAIIIASLSVASLVSTNSLSHVTDGLSSAQAKHNLSNGDARVRPHAPERTRLAKAYGELPMIFEANHGQTDARVKFLARGQGYTLFLASDEAVLSLYSDERQTPAGEEASGGAGRAIKQRATRAASVLRIKLAGAQTSPRVEGIDESETKSHYFVGRDARRWVTGVASYSAVKYTSVYPGIDLVYYGNQRQLEYDFHVAPGADTSHIALTFEGAQNLRLSAEGDLVLDTSGGEVRQQKPYIYQEKNGVRREVAGNYRITGANSVGFRIGDYDRALPLVIDPVIVYSSLFGGVDNEEGLDIAVGADGSAYVAGVTLSPDFPGSGATFGARSSESSDAYIFKLNPAGSSLIYAAYIGGNGGDIAHGIAVDSAGNAYVSGSTASTNFPVTTGAFQTSLNGPADAFVLKVDASGSSLAYSTLLGGGTHETARSVAVDGAGNAYVVGNTDSAEYPALGLSDAKSGSPAFKSTDAGGNWTESDAGLAAQAVNAFAIHPTNGNIVYAGTNEGLFKSTDGGAHWVKVALTSSPSLFPLVVNSIAIDPSNPAIIYVGTDLDIFKSTDGGATFSVKSDGIDIPLIHVIRVDPTTPTTVYAGTRLGFYRSTNGGEDWHLISSGFTNLRVSDMAVKQSTPTTVYLATDRRLMKSPDGGTTLVFPANNGLPFGVMSDLVIDPSAPATLYATMGFVNNVFKTTDGGENWVALNGIVAASAMAIDPSSPNTIYAGTFSGGIFKSTNGGASWTAINSGLTTRTVRAIAIDPTNASKLFAGMDSGDDVFVAKINPAGSAPVYYKYLGGFQNDSGNDIALDGSNQAYVTGTTESDNFPTANAFQSSLAGRDAFVTKFSADGATTVYSTFLGGSNSEEGNAIAVDAGGSAYVTGATGSTNFPLLNPLKNSLGSSFNDAFVTRFSPNGASLVYSTYLGGNLGAEQGRGIAVDGTGHAYVTGLTASNDFPVVDDVQAARGGLNDAFIAKLNPAGASLIYSTYLGGITNDHGNAIRLDAQGSVYVVGTTASSDFPATTANGYRGGGDAFVLKLIAPATTVQFAATQYSVNENAGSVNVKVVRSGDVSAAASVDYATADGSAQQKRDYTTTSGTLRFAAGETEKTVHVFITDDRFDESSQSFTLQLTNPNGAMLGARAVTTVLINDNDDVTAPSPVRWDASFNSDFFVRQHYLDFLNREPDASGLAFWTNQIEECGANVACREVRRVNVSAAFFLSPEFQETGYHVIRVHRAAFGGRSNSASLRLGYRQFIGDARAVGEGFIGGQPGSEQILAANKQSYAVRVVTSAAFIARFPVSQSAAEYVDALYASAGVTPTAAERQAAIEAFGAGATAGRAQALTAVADSSSVRNAEFRAAFVLMEYFGYLRRNPTDPPDADDAGYQFWLGKLNEFGGNYIAAEMVKAFITSPEYIGRFGQ